MDVDFIHPVLISEFSPIRFATSFVCFSNTLNQWIAVVESLHIHIWFTVPSCSPTTGIFIRDSCRAAWSSSVGIVVILMATLVSRKTKDTWIPSISSSCSKQPHKVPPSRHEQNFATGVHFHIGNHNVCTLTLSWSWNMVFNNLSCNWLIFLGISLFQGFRDSTKMRRERQYDCILIWKWTYFSSGKAQCGDK